MKPHSEPARPKCRKIDAGPYFIFLMEFRAGDVMPLHVHHQYAHPFTLAEGTVDLRTGPRHGDLVTHRLTAPAVLIVPKGHLHDITAITDAVGWCTHRLRHPNGDLMPFDYEPCAAQRMEAVGGV